MLKDLSRELDELSIGINAIIRKLEEYLNLSRRTKAYALAMGDYIFLPKYRSSSNLVTVLNPTIKLRWLGQHWEEEGLDNAKSVIRAASSERCWNTASSVGLKILKRAPPTVTPSTATRRPVQPPASQAARAQKSGFARLHTLAKELSGSDLIMPTTHAPAQDELSEQEKEEAEHRAVMEDERIVDAEIERYQAAGILDKSSPEFENFDLVRYWDRYQTSYLQCTTTY
ncbi:hypothetical protein GGX14DRAFT_578409 [Mycena pura]|uniref:HAT C-terminal dimerisation domain-containing protein n=1 Tax=Mycena pura TaxID=153505 RepID=A0AAD6UWW0_9AGAR|nr:hypothetical protein GGX14DRAFT_578409 [Mycena pura]